MKYLDSKAGHWILSTAVAVLGGGFAAAFAAMMDPSKYSFPRDLGSGKLWPFFFMGCGLTFLGILVKSPFGKKMIAFAQQSREDLERTQKELEQAKTDLKRAAGHITEAQEKKSGTPN